MNKELEQFIDHMVKPESVEDIKNYVENKIILEDKLTLCCNYTAGTGSIVGVVQGQPVIIKYNHFYYPESFIFKINDKAVIPPISIDELKQFFIRADSLNKPKLIEVDDL